MPLTERPTAALADFWQDAKARRARVSEALAFLSRAVFSAVQRPCLFLSGLFAGPVPRGVGPIFGNAARFSIRSPIASSSA